MSFKRLILILPLLLASGCAFSVYDVNVGYNYTAPAGTARLPTVKIGAFTDGRGTANPRLIMNQRNMNGDVTSGGWQAEKPLADIVRDATAQAFAGSADVGSLDRFEISGTLQDFSSEMVMGVWSSEWKGKLTQRFRLRDLTTGEVIWQDTFVGQGNAKGSTSVPAVDVFRASLDQVMNSLLQDEVLRSKLK